MKQKGHKTPHSAHASRQKRMAEDTEHNPPAMKRKKNEIAVEVDDEDPEDAEIKRLEKLLGISSKYFRKCVYADYTHL